MCNILTFDQYDGDFKNGSREGEGTMMYGETLRTNGKIIYTGHFPKGKRCGEGVYKYLKAKDLYIGSWKNGLKPGKDTFIIHETKIKLKGERFNGQRIKRTERETERNNL